MSSKSAKTLARQAEGKMKAKNLTKTGGLLNTYLYDDPLIEYLREDEQPEFIYAHEDKGFRIIHPDGTEETPHHDLDEGKRYVLVTDQRILYVAGRPDGDESMSFGYDELTDVEGNQGRIDSVFRFTDDEGVEYKFVNTKIGTDVERAPPYVEERIEEATTPDHELDPQSSPLDALYHLDLGHNFDVVDREAFEPDIDDYQVMLPRWLDDRVDVAAAATALPGEAVQYEPEHFDGLIYHYTDEERSVDAVIFESGDMAMFGDHLPDLKVAAKEIEDEFADLGVLESGD